MPLVFEIVVGAEEADSEEAIVCFLFCFFFLDFPKRFFFSCLYAFGIKLIASSLSSDQLQCLQLFFPRFKPLIKLFCKLF